MPEKTTMVEFSLDEIENFYMDESDLLKSFVDSAPINLEFVYPEELLTRKKSQILLNISTTGGETSDQEVFEFNHQSYHVMMVLRIETAFAYVNPSEAVRFSMQPLTDINHRWVLQLNLNEKHENRFWVYLEFIPENNSEVQQFPMISFPFEVTGYDYFGLFADDIKNIGVIFIVAHILMVLPILYRRIIKKDNTSR